MNCSQCGAGNVPDVPFCASCGAPLSQRPAPPNKTLAVVSLVLGLVSIPTLGCLGLGAVVAIVLGVMALLRANRDPQTYGGQALATGGIVSGGLALVVALPLGLVVAAIAIPSLLRAKIAANEAAAVGDVRTFLSAEAAYASANGGFYDTPDCLASPAACIPGGSMAPPIEAGLVSDVPREGYRRRFHAGPTPWERPAFVSRSSMTAFAFTATPVVRQRTGVRAFCGDSTGRICSVADGEEPEVIEGVCGPSCAGI